MLISGKLVNQGPTNKPDVLKFINNRVLFLFYEMRYELEGTVIDKRVVGLLWR